MMKGGGTPRPNKKGKGRKKKCKILADHKRLRIMHEMVQSHYREVNGKRKQSEGERTDGPSLPERTEKEKEERPHLQKTTAKLKKFL